MSQSSTLSDWLKKKGRKFGFWHRRYCTIVGTRLTVAKDEQSLQTDRIIVITAGTRTEIVDEEKHPRFVIFPEKDRPICLAHDSVDTVRTWVYTLRNLTLHSPNLNMSCFDVIAVLGRGFYGKVMLCRRKSTDQYFAIKTIHKNRLVQAHKVHTIFNERDVLMKSHHPFITSFAFSFQTETKVYLGLEYVAGGELFHHFRERRRIPLPEVRLYIAEVSLAINYLHVQGVIYRDLKPENILVDTQGHLKLTDFGLAKQLEAAVDTTTTFCGTSEYLAPEIILRKPYGMKIDWWAVGVLTYELLFGQTPFYNENKIKMFERIRNETPTFSGKVDSATVSFITMLLEKDPENRADFEKVHGHPFFAGLDFEKVFAKEYKPAFVPPSNEFGLQNFDREFTAEEAIDSFATPTKQTPDQFIGFSCAGDDLSKQSSSDGESEKVTPSKL